MLIFALYKFKIDTVMDEFYKSEKSKVLNIWNTITPNVEGVGDKIRSISAEAISDYCFNTYYAQISFSHIKVNSSYIMLDCDPDVDVFGRPLATMIKHVFCGAILAVDDVDNLIAKSFRHLQDLIINFWQSKLEFYEAN